MDYRKHYKKYINVDKNFEIHHLDLNRSNNCIYNLVSIPKNVHEKFHKIMARNNNFKNTFISTNCQYSNDEIIKSLIELEELQRIISYYINKRDNELNKSNHNL